MSFDPNGTGNKENGLFALPFTEKESQVIIIPVPWEVTTSYGGGAAFGPDTILASSHQLDLCDASFDDFYHKGLFMAPVNPTWLAKNSQLKPIAKGIQESLEKGQSLSNNQTEEQSLINQESHRLNQEIEQRAQGILQSGKVPAVVGGDHSSPFGLIKALSSKYDSLSILHIDAHMDFRKSYQGFEYSHASIMRNVHEQMDIDKIVQLGIRDFCPEERAYGEEHGNIVTYFDGPTQLKLHQGQTWGDLCQEILSHLSNQVYISFDIDGLSPNLCPHTGTPVPGGLDFAQINTLLHLLNKSDKNVVGFDLCEVSPASSEDLDGWDGNVGARILYKLCATALS